MGIREDALEYHRSGRPGKVEIVPTKPLSTQYDLALAYSPGVAEPCREIALDEDASFLYTARGNLVAVITDGTAVLGLGDIGPAAAKPVMEGKSVLFKRFAGIDSVDLELRRTSVDQFVEAVAAMEPSFGGINLEDIRSPECFEIERRLKERLSIPVMHDDQHGTAIIAGAGLINAAEITGKELPHLKVVVVGAGAAAIACTRLLVKLGVRTNNLVMVDEGGVIRRDRAPESSDPAMEFATERDISTLAEALTGADVLLGLSVGNIVTPEILETMAPDPILFTLANPDPEIAPETARKARPDAIIATGRSDAPNQINNVLGFPFIFRGALDVGAREINDEMKIAAVHAIARLAREPIPASVSRAYTGATLRFGREYLIPKPLDPRLITTIAPAVARAAQETGVARYRITDWAQYEARLLERIGMGQKLITGILARARQYPRTIVLPEGLDYEVLKAADIAAEQKIARPVLLGPVEKVRTMIANHGLENLQDVEILDPAGEPARCRRYAEALHKRRQRRGLTLTVAEGLILEQDYFAAAMVAAGDADAMVSGRTRPYPQIVRPALHTIGIASGTEHVSGLYVINTRKGVFFFADTTVNTELDDGTLLDIISLTVDRVRSFEFEPVVALLSHSNFGSSPGAEADRMARVAEEARRRYPDIVIDGEIQANAALDGELLREVYPFSPLADAVARGRRVNTLIFPNLAAGNIAHKLMGTLGEAEMIGPILTGMARPVHVLKMGSHAREILHMIAIAVTDAGPAQERELPLGHVERTPT